MLSKIVLNKCVHLPRMCWLTIQSKYKMKKIFITVKYS